MITTDRLILMPLTKDWKRAVESSRSMFAKKFRIVLPDNWTQAAQTLDPEEIELEKPWCQYVFVGRRTGQVVGRGGFLSVPDKNGDVEIEYEIAPDYQSYGFATEVVEALIRLSAERGVRFVFANTPAKAKAAIAVARKAGMEFVDDAWNKNFGEIWRFRVRCDSGTASLGHVSLRMSA